MLVSIANLSSKGTLGDAVDTVFLEFLQLAATKGGIFLSVPRQTDRFMQAFKMQMSP